jgi:hypothetical protein
VAKRKAIDPTFGTREVEESNAIGNRGDAAFQPVIIDRDIIDESDQFLIFQYWARLPEAEKNRAMDEQSALGERLRSAWASYLAYKKISSEYAPRRRPKKPKTPD